MNGGDLILKSLCGLGLCVLLLAGNHLGAAASSAKGRLSGGWATDASSGTPAKKVRRIRFVHGGTEATVTGRLRGQNDVVHFVIRVRKGQHMEVAVRSDDLTNPQIDVIFPSGEHMDRDMQGTQFRTDETQAGDYRIDVYEGRKGDPSNGTFSLTVKVTG